MRLDDAPVEDGSLFIEPLDDVPGLFMEPDDELLLFGDDVADELSVPIDPVLLEPLGDAVLSVEVPVEPVAPVALVLLSVEPEVPGAVAAPERPTRES